MSSQNTDRGSAEQPHGAAKHQPVDQQTVIDEELKQICRRRKIVAARSGLTSESRPAAVRQADHQCNGQAPDNRRAAASSPPCQSTPAADERNDSVSPEHVRNSLVGVALSGGGVRSGAISLGFLMGLARHRLLQGVDYLSTVSGGGYAGAMVTAEAERLNRARSDGSTSPPQELLFQEAPSVPARSTSRPRHRLRHLIFNANYLIKNRGWASRALIGTMAMGTMLVSALVFVCASLAWLCRLAYKPEHYDVISAMGFRGDIWVALLPTVVLFVLWLFCWLLSYLVNRRRASGLIARYVFAGWILSLVVGLTLIATTGDVEVQDLLSKLGMSQKSWHDLGTVGSAIQSVVVLGILTSLLPYFVPSALFRSGKERTVGPRKFIFRFARSGLLYGLPLLLFGYLARENISHWNQQRDARLTMADLMTPAAASAARLQAAAHAGQNSPVQPSKREPPLSRTPFFDDLLTSADGSDDDSLTQQIARRLMSVSPVMTRTAEGIPKPGAPVGSVGSQTGPTSRTPPGSAPTSNAPTSNAPTSNAPTAARPILHALRNSFEIRLQLQAFNSDHRNAPPHLWAEQTFGNEYTEKSRLERISQFISQQTSGREPSDLQQIRILKQRERRLLRGVLYRLNRRLLDYELFADIDLPADASPSLASAFRDLRQLVALIRSSHLSSRLRTEADRLQILADADLPDLTDTGAVVARSPFRERMERILETHESQTDLFATLAMSDSAAPEQQSSGRADNGGTAGRDPGESQLSAKEFLHRQALARKILSVHREILRAAFPHTIHPYGPAAPIFNSNVYTKDQNYRLEIMWTSLLCALLASLIIDLNATSWHGFYAQQLSDFWIDSGRAKEKRICLQSANSTEAGYPYHLINAAVSFLGRPALGEDVIRDENPDDFLLSRLYCGSDHTDVGFVRTTKSAYGELTLGDAIALSGSAVSPWTTSNQLVRALFLVLNLRTGLWLPHPQSALHNHTLLDKIDTHLFPPLRWLSLRFMRIPWNRFQQRPPEKWSHLLVTDGGHYENLGIEPLLRRRCRLIVAVDSTEDENYEFGCLAGVINRVRSAEGIEFLQPDSDQPFQFPDAIVPDPETRFSKTRICSVRIHYPETREQPACTGVLILVKSTLLEDDPLELRSIRKKNAAFPNDPTSDQFFSPETFEAYHRLGGLAADQLANQLQAALSQPEPDQEGVLANSPEIKTLLRRMPWPPLHEQPVRPHPADADPKPMIEHLRRSIDSLTMMLRDVLHDDQPARHSRELKQVLGWLRSNLKYMRTASLSELPTPPGQKWDLDQDICGLLAEVAAHGQLKECRATAIELIELSFPHFPPRDLLELHATLDRLLATGRLRGGLKDQLQQLLTMITSETAAPTSDVPNPADASGPT